MPKVLIVMCHAQNHHHLFEDDDQMMLAYERISKELEKPSYSNDKGSVEITTATGIASYVISKMEGVRIVDEDKWDSMADSVREQAFDKTTARQIRRHKQMIEAGIVPPVKETE